MPCMSGWPWVGANDDPGAYWICDCRPIPRSPSIPTLLNPVWDVIHIVGWGMGIVLLVFG